MWLNLYIIRLLSQKRSLSGGTSLITTCIPPSGRVSLSKQKLTNEMGLVSNIKSKVVQKHTKTALKLALWQLNHLKEPRVSCRGLLLLSGIIKNICEGCKGSVLIKPEQAIEKADYKCGKSFHLDPILDNYKKKRKNRIVNKILEMIAKANRDRLDFGLKKITKDHSHAVFTNETKYQNYKQEPNSKTKIMYNRKLFQYGDMGGLDIVKVKPPKTRFHSHVKWSSALY